MASTTPDASIGDASTPTPPRSSSPSHVRIYTRGGDGGKSSLFTGERRLKDDAVFHALGDVDELNAHLGVVLTHAPHMEGEVLAIQSRLMDVGSCVATPTSTASEERLKRVALDVTRSVEEMESWIDAMEAALPPLRNFILPSGGAAATALHVARTVCRRAERSVTTLVQGGHAPDEASKYLNRLSDYLFVAARFAAMKSGAVEHVYQKATGVTDRPLA